MSRITLFGFYNYDKTILDDIELPTGIDKDIVINELIYQLGDLFPYTQSPIPLKRNIHYFFKKRYDSYKKMIDALNTEYNPLENYDRFEHWTDTPNITNTSTPTGSDTVTNQVSAYDTQGFINDSKSTSAYNSKVENVTEGVNTHDGRLHGNIGVTTSQQMLQSELDLRKYDIYDTIVKEFSKAIIIEIY